jgi:hypothetical protein
MDAITAWIEKARADGREVPNPSRPRASVTPHQADLAALLRELRDKEFRLRGDLGSFNAFESAMKELIQHPPPHTDQDVFWQHLEDRIRAAIGTLDKMRELIPEEMRLTR